MKHSIKIAEAAKVVEICKKIKQDFPNFKIKECYLNIPTEDGQKLEQINMFRFLKLEQIKYDYDYYTKLYNKLHKQKLINDYFETEEGKALKIQLEETIKNGNENKNKIFDEYHEIFRSLVKSKFGQEFDIFESWRGLKIAYSDTIEYKKNHNSDDYKKTEFQDAFCFCGMRKKNPFILIRCYNDEITIETFGFEFIELKDNKKQTELFIKIASLLSDKELQNKIISIFGERRKKIDEITKIIEDAEYKLKNPFENENSIS